MTLDQSNQLENPGPSNDESLYLKATIRGLNALTNLDILSTLCGSRSKAISILNYTGGSIDKIMKMQSYEFEAFLGEKQAMNMISACLLHSRRQVECQPKRFHNSKEVAGYLEAFLLNENAEKFYTIFLNRNNEIISCEELFKGGVSATIIDPRIVFKRGVLLGASGIICGHNHPSGNLSPSQADIEITHKLKKGAKLLDINLLDHLIISKRGYYSFADEGNLG